MMDALIIKDPWISKIFAGEKVWEVRGSDTVKRGTIKLIKSGTGLVIGEIELVDSRPLTQTIFNMNKDKHRIETNYDKLPYGNPRYWEFANPVKYDVPIKYTHPAGAIIWVKNIETREIKED